uniref:Ribosomal protein S10 n=1 Tax=Cyanophora paradoxa TaxID=2762 RepID=E9P1F1_CYAPA|nr:ribosomal protein S10 [Cyanophora paradoxa]ADW79203.1 ribosomal protein S10 [Cyanophora paradoxa]
MIKIYIFSHYFLAINFFVKTITYCLSLKKIPFKVYPQPKKCSILTTLRSPHVNKNSMEHFKIEKFKYIIEINNINNKISKKIFNKLYYYCPAGLTFYIKYQTNEFKK